MRTRKSIDLDESGACTQDSDTTYLYSTNTKKVSHGSEVWKGVVWQWGEGGAYFGVSAQALLGEMSYWDDISSKRNKYELESLGACYKGW